MLCRFSDAGNDDLTTRWRPASEKRQGTKSRREVVRRSAARWRRWRRHYGDLEMRLGWIMPGRDEGCGRFALR